MTWPTPITHDLYVISDLHLGGRDPEPADPHDRGFRLMTQRRTLVTFIERLAAHEAKVELVINGDFVDFLAEEHERGARWRPFLANARAAVRTFETLARRDRVVFEALGNFVRTGHALTLILGNHDLELCLPAVRGAMERIMEIQAGSYRFIHDGEAYRVGDVLIEHGNRYDPFNIVDHDALRRVRSLQSREQAPERQDFEPPAGSVLVSEVINDLKGNGLPFVDLLKPESEPLFALLLALDPSLRWKLSRVVKAKAHSMLHEVRGDEPVRMGDLAATDALTTDGYFSDLVSRGEDDLRMPRDSEDDDPLLLILERALGDDASEFLATVDEVLDQDRDEAEPDVVFRGADVSRTFGPRSSVARLLLQGGMASRAQRMRLLQRALASLDADETFDQSVETGRRYREAAEKLTDSDRSHAPRFVIFGHTHYRKTVPLSTGATYVNTGAWTDRMRFPDALRHPDPVKAWAALEAFLDDLRKGNLAPYIEFEPGYAHISRDEHGRTQVDLLVFDPEVGGLP